MMIKRVPTENNNVEFPFYGCRNYPDCKVTRAILPDGSVEPELAALDDLSWIGEAAEEATD
jgi:ssDNA-binding Zn-finger/Zn-ribbon topoisomerase 1